MNCVLFQYFLIHLILSSVLVELIHSSSSASPSTTPRPIPQRPACVAKSPLVRPWPQTYCMYGDTPEVARPNGTVAFTCEYDSRHHGSYHGCRFFKKTLCRQMVNSKKYRHLVDFYNPGDNAPRCRYYASFRIIHKKMISLVFSEQMGNIFDDLNKERNLL